MRTYTGRVHSLKVNEYFVFGSNTQGRHGKGAALTAKRKFGAIYGQATGLQGQSYAIVTKDLTKKIHPSIPQMKIVNQIGKLYDLAIARPDWLFYIAYSGSGTNLNGYTPGAMATLFSMPIPLPENIVFEEEFSKLITLGDTWTQ